MRLAVSRGFLMNPSPEGQAELTAEGGRYTGLAWAREWGWLSGKVGQCQKKSFYGRKSVDTSPFENKRKS